MSEHFFRALVLRRQQDVDQAKALLDHFWQGFADKDDPLRVEISIEDSSPSEEHIRYYRGYILRPIAEQVWITPDSDEAPLPPRQFAAKVWHEELLEMFAPRVDRVFGSVPKRTNDMKRKEFTKFVQDIEVCFSHAPYFVQFPDRSEPPAWLAQRS
jgi:hypothetical protein